MFTTPRIVENLAQVVDHVKNFENQISVMAFPALKFCFSILFPKTLTYVEISSCCFFGEVQGFHTTLLTLSIYFTQFTIPHSRLFGKDQLTITPGQLNDFFYWQASQSGSRIEHACGAAEPGCVSGAGVWFELESTLFSTCVAPTERK